MDIKQTVNARAILTLGSAMIFRDYAQGAYRLRGIGNGQTLSLYVTPQVVAKIHRTIEGDSQNKTASQYLLQQSSMEGKSLLVDRSHHRVFLNEISSALIIFGINSEENQLALHKRQSILNVVRKRSFQYLLNAVDSLSSEVAEIDGPLTSAAIDVFRERIDNEISNRLEIGNPSSKSNFDDDVLHKYGISKEACAILEDEDRRKIDDINTMYTTGSPNYRTPPGLSTEQVQEEASVSLRKS